MPGTVVNAGAIDMSKRGQVSPSGSSKWRGRGRYQSNHGTIKPATVGWRDQVARGEGRERVWSRRIWKTLVGSSIIAEPLAGKG